MFGDFLQPTHIIFVMLVALLVLGPKRLPEVGKSLGKSLRDFRGAMSGIEEHTHDIFDASKPLPVAATEPAESVAPAPEPVMATAASAEAPSETAAATQESPAVAPRADELS